MVAFRGIVRSHARNAPRSIAPLERRAFYTLPYNQICSIRDGARGDGSLATLVARRCAEAGSERLASLIKPAIMESR